MKKLSTILIIIVIIGFLPIGIFAQFDFLDDMINDDKSIYELSPDTTDTTQTQEEGAMSDENISLVSCDLVWSTDSYVPYDYPGRALPAIDGYINASVIIAVTGGSSENLQYSWFVDNLFDESQSGYGRKDFKFGIRRGEGETHTILVKIFNEDNSFYMEKSTTIPIVKQEILIYPSIKNLLFSEETNKTMAVSSNRKISFVTKPFFFSIKKATDLNYNWGISGQDTTQATGFDSNILSLSVETRGDLLETRNLLLTVDNGALFPKQSIIKSMTIQIR